MFIYRLTGGILANTAICGGLLFLSAGPFE
jgi:hypothetical protein